MLTTPDQGQACVLLQRCLKAAAGGALLPFQELIEHHPDWLRKALLQAEPCAVRDGLLARLPTVTCIAPLETTHTNDTLSVRELSVLQLIAQGCSNQEISNQLFISLHTVKTHASHINSKLGVERRTQAVARAQELGLLGGN